MAAMVELIRRAALGGVALYGVVVLGGCSTAGTGGPSIASIPMPGLGATPVPAVSPVEATPIPVPVNYGGFLGGPTGSKLPEADREAALAAENGAISSGERRTWKGAKGVFGYVVPGPTAAASTAVPADGAPAECRTFTSTVFFAGRPQTGHGTGCRDLDGNWHVTS